MPRVAGELRNTASKPISNRTGLRNAYIHDQVDDCGEPDVLVNPVGPAEHAAAEKIEEEMAPFDSQVLVTWKFLVVLEMLLVQL